MLVHCMTHMERLQRCSVPPSLWSESLTTGLVTNIALRYLTQHTNFTLPEATTTYRLPAYQANDTARVYTSWPKIVIFARFVGCSTQRNELSAAICAASLSEWHENRCVANDRQQTPSHAHSTHTGKAGRHSTHVQAGRHRACRGVSSATVRAHSPRNRAPPVLCVRGLCSTTANPVQRPVWTEGVLALGSSLAGSNVFGCHCWRTGLAWVASASGPKNMEPLAHL
jgi:hypothetical protein